MAGENILCFIMPNQMTTRGAASDKASAQITPLNPERDQPIGMATNIAIVRTEFSKSEYFGCPRATRHDSLLERVATNRRRTHST